MFSHHHISRYFYRLEAYMFLLKSIENWKYQKEGDKVTPAYDYPTREREFRESAK